MYLNKINDLIIPPKNHYLQSHHINTVSITAVLYLFLDIKREVNGRMPIIMS